MSESICPSRYRPTLATETAREKELREALFWALGEAAIGRAAIFKKEPHENLCFVEKVKTLLPLLGDSGEKVFESLLEELYGNSESKKAKK